MTPCSSRRDMADSGSADAMPQRLSNGARRCDYRSHNRQSRRENAMSLAAAANKGAAPATRFFIQRAAETPFVTEGLRNYLEYRDLGMRQATGGQVLAHVIRAREAIAGGTGRHTHDLTFQMVYILKGTARFWYEEHGEFDLHPGDCVYQAPGIRHEFVSCSDDLELLEITMPADFETDEA